MEITEMIKNLRFLCCLLWKKLRVTSWIMELWNDQIGECLNHHRVSPFQYSNIPIFISKGKCQMIRTLMNRMIGARLLFLLLLRPGTCPGPTPAMALGAGPLPSWNDGPAKKAIVELVKATTEKGSPRNLCRRRRALPRWMRTGRPGWNIRCTRRSSTQNSKGEIRNNFK